MGSIGLPLPPIGLPPAPSQKMPWWEQRRAPSGQTTPTFDLRRIPGWSQGNVAAAMLDQQHTRQQISQQFRHGQIRLRPHNNYGSSVVYVLPTYGGYVGSAPVTYDVAPATAQPVSVAPSEQLMPMGTLRLDVEPRAGLQIFIDGVYVGTPDDISNEFDISAGTHHVELRASGYRTLAFDVAIAEGRAISYRGSLDRDASAPAAPPAVKPIVRPAGSRIMYVIPGCYMGNVSPKDITLPAGCDVSKITTISPP